MFSSKNFFSADQVKQIESAIKSAEENTSGEIRVHIERRCKGEEVECATLAFHKLGMHKTLLRNGVLFYLALKDKKFAVIGDEGIHKNVPEGFWDSVRDKMLEQFRQKRFTEGLCEGIMMTGAELKKYFPHSETDKDELSNEVTFGKQ
ncbi:MAG: TPM domain-containing protein [Bacteroidetes bacterium]|nr:TPM domain-containing protein [Bacteroidota bacterium]